MIQPSIIRPAAWTDPSLMDKTRVRAPIRASRVTSRLTSGAAEALRFLLRAQIGPSAPAVARVTSENRIISPQGLRRLTHAG